ncbi:MAG: AEC family transporter [Porcipelethomonas sp.]
MSSFFSDFIFSLNATFPVFLMMVLGWIMRKVKIFDESSARKLSQFSFKVLLPALLFSDLSNADFISIWDTRFVLFCLAVTIISIAIAFSLSLLHRDKSERGEIVQASYRSSAAVLGIAFVNNIYGSSEMASLMIIGTVPIYNIIAVIILSLTSPEKENRKSTKEIFIKTAKDVVTNPIILGIAAGIIWSLLKIPQPVIMSKSISYLAGMASPLSLIALGALFQVSDAKSKLSLSLWITLVKLVGFCALFLPVAIAMGFTGEKLIAILVMLGSATTGSCFVMSKNMGHKGVVTSCAVMMTTLFSAVTLTLWLFLLKTMNYI